MFFNCLDEDQDIVQVHHHYTFYNEVPKKIIHHSLKGGGAVGHAKEHHQRFEKASVGMKGRLLFVAWVDADVVKTPPHVKFGEIFRPTELGDQFGYQGKGVLILDGY